MMLLPSNDTPALLAFGMVVLLVLVGLLTTLRASRQMRMSRWVSIVLTMMISAVVLASLSAINLVIGQSSTIAVFSRP